MMMGSLTSNKSRPHHHQQPTPCTRAHQIGSLALIATTFFLTRLFFTQPDLLQSSTSHPTSSSITFHPHRPFSWPESGYGSHLNLKIYVYDEDEIDGLKLLMYGRDFTITPDSCLKGQWGTQVKIHKLLLNSKYRTINKEEADLFFVPAYAKCVRMMGGLNDKEINITYVKVLSQMPYFRLSGGRNHIFVFPSGAGAHLFKSWATYLNRSIILTPEGDRTDKRDTSAFNTWKDIIIPGNVDDGMTKGGATLVQPLPLSRRKYLANFLGRAQGKVGRLQLIELAKKYPNKECVPVVLLWITFSKCCGLHSGINQVAINSNRPQLLEYLESIPDEEIEQLIARGRQVRCLWAYAPELQPCSAINGILWELQRKVRRFHQSAETFWFHNKTIVNRDLIPFSHWKLPTPLP